MRAASNINPRETHLRLNFNELGSLILRNGRLLAHLFLIAASVASLIFLVHAWNLQENAAPGCHSAFGKLDEHNGYLEIDVNKQDPTNEIFEGELFVYYPLKQTPPNAMTITRSAFGHYGSSTFNIPLVPWSQGKAFPNAMKIELPTSGATHRHFPFDSPHFEIALILDPPIQPKVIRFMNRTGAFIPICDSFKASWDAPNILKINVDYQRNPFVQSTVVFLCLGAFIFALLLLLPRTLESLATATASYFLSIWSLRGIVDRAILSYPTYFDMTLLSLSMLVLLIVSWRVITLGTSGTKVGQMKKQSQKQPLGNRK